MSPNNRARALDTVLHPAAHRAPPEEGMTGSPPNGGPTTTTVPWHIRALSFFTLYGELSVACTPEEFASLRSRLLQEWSFDGGFVRRFTTVSLDPKFIHHSTYSSWVFPRNFFAIRWQFGTLTTTAGNRKKPWHSRAYRAITVQGLPCTSKPDLYHQIFSISDTTYLVSSVYHG